MAFGTIKVDDLISSSGNTVSIATITSDDATTSVSGLMSAADKTKLNNVAASANNYAISADLLDEDNLASDSATKAASQQSIKAYVDNEVAGLVNSAPSSLDTLNELSAALGDDSNYAATVTTSLGLKAPLASPTFTGDATCTGTISDVKGDVRTIPQNTQSSAYTLVATDAGKHILAGGNITIPNSVFAAGDAITIINDSGGNNNLYRASSLVMYNAGDGTDGDLVIAPRTMATILFTSGSEAYISGTGLS